MGVSSQNFVQIVLHMSYFMFCVYRNYLVVRIKDRNRKSGDSYIAPAYKIVNYLMAHLFHFSETQVWQLLVEKDTRLGLAKVYRTWYV